MPAKTTFSKAQQAVLLDAAKKLRRKYKSQAELALALGLTQPSVSAILRGTWVPGVTTAQHIAEALGQSLESLIGPYGAEERPNGGLTVMTYGNLDVCLAFHAPRKMWKPWTIAAARAGLFGPHDFAPPDWPVKLDALEKDLERFREKSV